MQKGGVLFNDSADKAARFIWLCDAFEIPLLFLADVPGFMIGTDVEKRGIIRHGAKMISAVSEATVPKISVIVRKAYGAGLYAMAGPAYDSDAVIALPTAQIAVMGPEPAINAVYYNKLADLPEDQRAARRKELEDARRASSSGRSSAGSSRCVSDPSLKVSVPLTDRVLRRSSLAGVLSARWPNEIAYAAEAAAIAPNDSRPV